MRIIITGGTGLIGRDLTLRFLGEGHEVIVLSRDPVRQKDSIAPGAKAVRWDARTGSGWSGLIDGDTTIINLAGQNPANWRWTAAHKRRVLESRLNAVAAVKDAITRASAKPRILLQASAVGYYGDRGAQPLTEESQPGNDWLAEVCQQWEAAAYPIDVRKVILRIGVVMSRHGGALPSLVWASRLSSRRLGSGEQYFPWIHLEDTARAIRFLMYDDRAEGVYNVCAHPVTNHEIMSLLSRIEGIPALIPVPDWAMRLALGEQAAAILDSQRVIPQRLDDLGFTFRFSHVEAALRNTMR